MRSMRGCKFIRTEDGAVWVPSPSSWLGGWARHRWLERHFGEGVAHVAGAEYWATLCMENQVKFLKEEEGVFVEEVSG